ncbi:NAD(P)-dependent oxidoreductase [Mycobacterium sp. 852002-51057_SCH5723018]|uniref:NAD(P)-dependent oxidoreductase n=1 Tax=Mycobacterium sp. 852002-51057_SCH5723018 TaxID=1834094 RepID=UPI0007FF4968|nr:NAD(P)H-binding protein [Mycobacterium sp. 852002-51057_SCH5723018]OBG19747.1 NAD-dependent epimerase [Mycobacterium sp. 852002-51057_SCH5723018]
MRLVIFGSNGPTGRLATARAVAAGHSVVAATRRPPEFPFAHPQLTVVEADVRNYPAVLDAVNGADAVVSVLGVPFTRRPVDTYSLGTANIIGAMCASGTRRLIVVSSTSVYPTRRHHAPLSLRLVEPITKAIGKTVYDDMRRMEAIVRHSGTDWTIVRASGLFDLPEPTDYVCGPVDPVGAFTARIDLADYLIALAAETASIRRIVIISTTQHTPTLWQMVRQEALSSKGSRVEPKPSLPLNPA